MRLLFAVVAVVLLAVGGLLGLREFDRRENETLWSGLARFQPPEPALFEPGMIAGLPPPAQRMFLAMIAPGTPLYRVVEIDMTGTLGQGDKADPREAPMVARQILAPPRGFVWEVQSGEGVFAMNGTDASGGGTSFSRFWLGGLIPVARAGGDPDHARSSYGRMAAEAAFWAPATLLPGPGVKWEAVDSTTARVTLARLDFSQTVEITVAPDGLPSQVVIERWTNANPQETYQLQPFGGTLSEFRDFGGYLLPTRVEGGNFFGTEDYFPFFKATVTDIRFPRPGT